jgi:hypothetical protein
MGGPHNQMDDGAGRLPGIDGTAGRTRSQRADAGAEIPFKICDRVVEGRRGVERPPRIEPVFDPDVANSDQPGVGAATVQPSSLGLIRRIVEKTPLKQPGNIVLSLACHCTTLLHH